MTTNSTSALCPGWDIPIQMVQDCNANGILYSYILLGLIFGISICMVAPILLIQESKFKETRKILLTRFNRPLYIFIVVCMYISISLLAGVIGAILSPFIFLWMWGYLFYVIAIECPKIYKKIYWGCIWCWCDPATEVIDPLDS